MTTVEKIIAAAISAFQRGEIRKAEGWMAIASWIIAREKEGQDAGR